MDIFLTIRHYDTEGKESKSSRPIFFSGKVRCLTIAENPVFYTGTTGEPVPVVKGWLRVSLRKFDSSHPAHRAYLPFRNYYSTDVQPVVPGEVYPVDVEVWPTNVIVGKGHTLGLQITGHDTQGSGLFEHTHPPSGGEAEIVESNPCWPAESE